VHWRCDETVELVEPPVHAQGGDPLLRVEDDLRAGVDPDVRMGECRLDGGRRDQQRQRREDRRSPPPRGHFRTHSSSSPAAFEPDLTPQLPAARFEIRLTKSA
jgi:hypothetical protein